MLEEFYSSAEMQSVYSTAPADWAIYIYIYIYTYISNIQSSPEDSGCGFFAYRIFEGYHINLCECLMYGLPSRLGLYNTPTVSRQRGKTPPNECPGYDNKQSDGEVPAMLELWGMLSTPSLPSPPDPLWPGVVAPDKGPIYGLNRTKPWFFHYTVFCI